jgi:hypothetical protein
MYPHTCKFFIAKPKKKRNWQRLKSSAAIKEEWKKSDKSDFEMLIE